MSGFRRWLSSSLTILSALACGAALVLWLLLLVGCEFCVGLQGPHMSYIGSVVSGHVVVQIASMSPDPAYPRTFGWLWFCDGTRAYAAKPLTESSFWVQGGVIPIEESVAYTDGMPMGQPNGNQAGINADCRSFVIPLWLIALVTAIRPGIWFRRNRQQIDRTLPQNRISAVRSLTVFAPVLAAVGICIICGLCSIQPEAVWIAIFIFFAVAVLTTVWQLIIWRRNLYWLSIVIGWPVAAIGTALVVLVTDMSLRLLWS